MSQLNSKHVKDSGSFKQRSGRAKKSDYASTHPDISVISTVNGLLPKSPYAGPTVAQHNRKDA